MFIPDRMRRIVLPFVVVPIAVLFAAGAVPAGQKTASSKGLKPLEYNKDMLVIQAVVGFIAPAGMGDSPYDIDPDGKIRLNPGTGSITYNFRSGRFGHQPGRRPRRARGHPVQPRRRERPGRPREPRPEHPGLHREQGQDLDGRRQGRDRIRHRQARRRRARHGGLPRRLGLRQAPRRRQDADRRGRLRPRAQERPRRHRP